MQFPPLFSILIANYNNGKYLMDAIESVRQQTYTNWEIILVDDASTDNSQELYETLRRDQRIHIFLNDQNHGCGYTKRRCADLATGELCGFLDPDDALTNDALRTMVLTYEKEGTDCAMFCARYALCNEYLERIYTTDAAVQTFNGNANYLLGECSITHFCTFNRELYLRTEGISEDMKRAVDQDLYLKMEEVGRKVFVPQILYLYRQQPKSISLGANRNKALYWHIVAIYKACQRRGIQKETEDIVARLLYNTADTAYGHSLQRQVENPTFMYLLRMLTRKLVPRIFNKDKKRHKD